MQTVEVVQNLQATDALLAVEWEKTHIIVVHAHERRDDGRFFGMQVMAVWRYAVAEAGIEEVKVVARKIAVEVRVETQETEKAHEENEVEVSDFVSFASVEPADGVLQIGKERVVCSFLA